MSNTEIATLVSRASEITKIEDEGGKLVVLELILELTTKRGEAIRRADDMRQPHEDALQAIHKATWKLEPVRMAIHRLRLLVAEFEKSNPRPT